MSYYYLSHDEDPLQLAPSDSSIWDYYSKSIVKSNVIRSTIAIDSLVDVQTKAKFIYLYRETFRRGILMLFYYGTRSFQVQYDLYIDYTLGEGGRAAPPGYSYHNYGYACDAMIIGTNGAKGDQSLFTEVEQVNIDFDLGLKSGRSYNDKGHWEYPKYTISQLQKNSAAYADWIDDNPTEVAEVVEIETGIEANKQKNTGWIFPIIIVSISGLIIFIVYKMKNK